MGSFYLAAKRKKGAALAMSGQCIMIASSKGGIGKSTAALGISLSLSRRSHRVLLCDLDLGNACLDMLMGAEDRAIYTVEDVMLGRCKAEDAVVQPYGDTEVYLLASPGASYSESTDIKKDLDGIVYAVRQAAEAVGCDFIILDTGAGVSVGSEAASAIADKALIVAGHSPLSVRSAERTAQRIRSHGVDDIRLIINSFDGRGVSDVGRSGIFSIMDTSGLELLGVVPYDYSLALSQERGRGTSDGFAARAFDNIAARLCREDVPLFSGMKKMRKMRNKFYN